MSNDHITQHSILISKQCLPSNDCLNTIFMFKFDKRQAELLPLRRLCKNANKYYQKPYILSHFKRPKKILMINHFTDHHHIASNLQKISSMYELKIHFNINLNTWREKVYAFDKEKQKYTNNAFKVLTYFISEYELIGFSLNYQLMLKNFDLFKAQSLIPKSNKFQYIRIGCSEIQIASLIILSQMPLKKLVIYESQISHCSSGIEEIQDQLKINESIEEFIFYKNQICHYGQQILFKDLLPYLTNLQKLKLPSNQLKDNIVDNILTYLKEQKEQTIKSLNIGNNHFKVEGLSKLLKFLTQDYFALKKLELSFQQFENPQSFKRIIEIIKESKTIEIYDFEGCNLNLQDVELLNQLLLSNKDLKIKQLRLGLNKFTDEQLTQRFRGDSFSGQSSTDASSLSDDERSTINTSTQLSQQLQNEQQILEESPILEIIERPIDTFQACLAKKLKMY